MASFRSIRPVHRRLLNAWIELMRVAGAASLILRAPVRGIGSPRIRVARDLQACSRSAWPNSRELPTCGDSMRASRHGHDGVVST